MNDFEGGLGVHPFVGMSLFHTSGILSTFLL